MAQQIFIADPCQETQTALADLGYEVTPFLDSGHQGVLTVAPVADFSDIAAAFTEITELRLMPDTTPAEFHGITRLRAISESEYASYSYTLKAHAILSSLQRQTTEVDAPIQECRDRFAASMRQMSLLAQRASEESDPAVELTERIQSEFQAILDHPQITKVEVGDSGFCVTTKELTCRDPRTALVHSIGKFCITFIFETHRSEGVFWRNQTRVIDGIRSDMHAPHVFSKGDACLGNMEGKFRELLNRGEYFAATDMAIRFIESVNITDPAGQYLHKWPLATRVNRKERWAQRCHSISKFLPRWLRKEEPRTAHV